MMIVFPLHLRRRVRRGSRRDRQRRRHSAEALALETREAAEEE